MVTAKLVKKVEPEYPAEAQEKKIQGSVKLQVVVQKDGSVAVQRAVEGDPIFYAAAIEAVRQWRYEPTFMNGQPIDMDMIITVTFALNH